MPYLLFRSLIYLTYFTLMLLYYCKLAVDNSSKPKSYITKVGGSNKRITLIQVRWNADQNLLVFPRIMVIVKLNLRNPHSGRDGCDCSRSNPFSCYFISLLFYPRLELLSRWTELVYP